MYWLLYNNEDIGPFATKKGALDYWRKLIDEGKVAVWAASLWFGVSDKLRAMLYPII